MHHTKKFPVCAKCKSVKYCSRDCQISHFKAGHKESWKRLQETKKESIEINRRIVAELVECYNPGCYKVEKSKITFMRCSRCKQAKYCSTDCQKRALGIGAQNDL